MSTTVTQTDVERRAGGDGNEYTYAEFVNYHNGDHKAAQADWNNSAAGLAGELSTGFGGMDLDDQEDQQQQQLLVSRIKSFQIQTALPSAQHTHSTGSATHTSHRCRARKYARASAKPPSLPSQVSHLERVAPCARWTAPTVAACGAMLVVMRTDTL